MLSLSPGRQAKREEPKGPELLKELQLKMFVFIRRLSFVME